MSDLPMPPERGPASAEEKRLSITIDPRSHAQAEFLADLWNAIDEAKKIKRYRKWGVTNVLPFLVQAQLAGVLERMGGYPEEPEARKQLIAKAVADVRREVEGEKKKKK